MTKLVETVIRIAKAENGYREGVNNKQKFSPAVPSLEWSQNQAWCATFVSWVALKAGAASLFPRTASCLAGVAWFKARKRFSEYPAIGAQAFYGAGGGVHTGLVYDYDGTYIYTVEGNTNDNGGAEGNGVYLKKRARRDAHVYGYGYPGYPEGIKSADPAWADKAPAPEKPKPLGVKGIDVSSYQVSTPSLTGADFVAVKATEGTGYVNPKHDAQVAHARKNGLVVGHYHFVKAGDMKAQADYFLKNAKAQKGEFLALDWEDSAVSCAQKDEFLKYLKSKADGRKVVLYCNTTFWLQRDTTSFAADGLWIAQYGVGAGKPKIEADWLIHQYTDKPVDTNVTHWATRADMQKWAGVVVADKPKRVVEWLPVTGFMPELHYGDAGWHVGWLQRNLNRFRKVNITETGKYDSATAKAVHEFYAAELNYKTTTEGKVFGADGWRRVLSVAKDEKGTN
ncbi:GH25 family lysozyme [Streptomyces nigrescens]